MAKAVMEVFPLIPEMKFGTSKKTQGQRERRDLVLEILEASGTYVLNPAYSFHSIDC